MKLKVSEMKYFLKQETSIHSESHLFENVSRLKLINLSLSLNFRRPAVKYSICVFEDLLEKRTYLK